MVRKTVLTIGSVVGGAALMGGLYFSQQEKAAADPFREFDTWQPTLSVIKQEMGQAQSSPEETKEQAQFRVFCDLFKKRFRSRDDQIAVGMRFLEQPERIKLMFPARMEPWEMDRVSVAAWKETKEAFGRPFEIDIYETLIGTKPRLIGTLRPIEGQPGMLRIIYTMAHRKI